MAQDPKRNENDRKKDRPKLGARFYVLLAILLVIIALLFLPGVRSFIKSFIHIMKDPDEFQEAVRREGKWAPLVFILIQIVQVIIAPIPGNVTTLAGGLLFGSGLGFLYGSIGLVIGSSFAFGLTRFYGKPFIIKFSGEENYNKYSTLFTKKGRILLFIIFLMPFFPDDMLCLLAGVSSMTYINFLLFVIFARLPGVLVSVYIGSGSLNLPVWAWIVLGIVTAILIYVSARYGDKIEHVLLTKLKKRFKIR